MNAIYIIVGLLAGFYARTIYDKLAQLHAYFKDRLESPPGVVRPQRRQISRSIMTDGETGPVLRPKPEAIENDRQEQRARMMAGDR